jgi:hypothetical protein
VGAVGTASYALSVTRSAVFILGAAGVGAMLSIWQARRLRVLERAFFHIKCLLAMAAAGVLRVLAFPLVADRGWSACSTPLGQSNPRRIPVP